MNIILKYIAALAITATLSSPALAQLSGEVSVSTTGFSAFSAKAAIQYNFALSETTESYAGLTYSNAFGIAGGGRLGLYGGIGVTLNSQLSFGAELGFSISSLGLNNDIGLVFIPNINYILVDSGQLTVVVSAQLPIRLVQGFGLAFNLFTDGYYIFSPQFGLAFGLRTGLTFISPFAFNGVGINARADFAVNEPLLVFAGFDSQFGNGIGFDLFAGIRFELSQSFALKLTAAYNGAFRLTLAGLYNR